MIFLSFLSAGLLSLSFPQREWFFLAWIALVPMLWAIDGTRPRTAFFRAWLCGFLFFAAGLGWIIYVTTIGAFLLAAFLALYFGVFGLLFIFFKPLPRPARMVVLAAAWVALEFIRGHFLTGFGWVMLGHSQYQNLWLIQIADTTGIYGISFLVMVVNLLVFEVLKARRLPVKETAVVAAVLAAVVGYGWHTVSVHKHNGTVMVGVVQPNIPLSVDWDDSKKPWIIAKTLRLTRAVASRHPDLIVWPETSVPGLITDDPLLVDSIKTAASRLHTPLVVGSMARDGEDYYNSAFLISADGQMQGRYDKIHLVPFGEYLPWRPLLGWINKFVPLDDFAFGKNYTVFSIGQSHLKRFATLICFEDTLGDLCRRFAQRDAEFFVNMTNDAWFKATREPFLHLQGAVFGCVENHRSLARAANTGVSALIDPWGHILNVVGTQGRKTFIDGTAAGVLPLNDTKTFYTKYGDVFTILCFLCILVAAAIRVTILK